MMISLKNTFTTLGLLIGLFLFAQPLFAQGVETISGRSADGKTMVISRDIPIRKNPVIKGDGQPTYLYVVQLARFVDMDYIPAEFPKGTFLWISPDNSEETLLLSGFFSTYEEAQADVKNWADIPSFKGCYARKLPFLVRYD